MTANADPLSLSPSSCILLKVAYCMPVPLRRTVANLVTLIWILRRLGFNLVVMYTWHLIKYRPPYV